MLVRKSAADKGFLAHKASERASELAAMLGHNLEIVVDPEQLLINEEEALGRILPHVERKFGEKLHSDPLGICTDYLSRYETYIRKKTPFTLDGMMYVPLVENRMGLLARSRQWDWRGAEAEIAHLVFDACYPHTGRDYLSETLDLLSQLFEKSVQGHLFLEEERTDFEENLAYTRTLLEHGEDALHTEMRNISCEYADILTSAVKNSYLHTDHPNGMLFFLALRGDDLDECFKDYDGIVTGREEPYSLLTERGFDGEFWREALPPGRLARMHSLVQKGIPLPNGTPYTAEVIEYLLEKKERLAATA